MKPLLYIFIFMILSSPAYAENYLCVGEKATGFQYKDGSKDWIERSFNPDDPFIIQSLSNTTEIYSVKQTGHRYPIAFCASGFNENDVMDCSGQSIHILFDRENLRYQKYFYGSYVRVYRNYPKDDTPSIEIGKCTVM